MYAIRHIMTSILEQIDAEINKLQQVRALLAGVTIKSGNIGLLGDTTPAVAKRRGRPKGSKNASTSSVLAVPKRTMSAEGKARIAAAQKKRWAAIKKAA